MHPEFKSDVHFHPLPSDEFADHVARCHFNTNQEFEDQFAVSLLLTTHCPHTNILLQSINGCDKDLPITIGTSQHLKKLNRFRNVTVCKLSRPVNC